MTPSSQDWMYLLRDHGSNLGLIQQIAPIRSLKSFPYKGIIMATAKEGATTSERLAAIIGPRI